MKNPNSAMALRIKTRLKELKLSQKKLAENVDATSAAVSCWVNGRNTPKGEHFDKLASALKVDRMWLITGENIGDKVSDDLVKLALKSSGRRSKQDKKLVGERIAQAMQQKAVDDLQIEKELEVTKTTIRSWLRGVSEPNGITLKQLAQVLQTSPEWIRYGNQDASDGSKSIGGRIHARMTELNLTNANISLQTGENTKSIDKWINNELIPNPRNVKRMAALLRVEPDWILYGTKPPNNSVAHADVKRGAIQESEEALQATLNSVDLDAVGKRIETSMLELGFNQTYLASAIGIGKMSVSRWIKGVSLPRSNHLFKLANILETTSDWLLYGIDESESKSDDSDGKVVGEPVVTKETTSVVTETGTQTKIVTTVVVTTVTTRIVDHVDLPAGEQANQKT